MTDQEQVLAMQPCWAAAVGSRWAGGNRVIPGSAWELWEKQQALTNQAAYIIETFPEGRFSDSAVKQKGVAIFGAPLQLPDYHSKSLRRFAAAACHWVTHWKYKKGATGISLNISPHPRPSRPRYKCLQSNSYDRFSTLRHAHPPPAHLCPHLHESLSRDHSTPQYPR